MPAEIPALQLYQAEWCPFSHRVRMRLKKNCRYLINPGSIGQPRDRNPAASYALYDGIQRVVTFERASYDVEKTRDKIHRAGLPGMLGDRLVIGA